MSSIPHEKLHKTQCCIVCGESLSSFHKTINPTQHPCCQAPNCQVLVNYLNSTPDSPHRTLHFNQQALRIQQARQQRLAQEEKENEIDNMLATKTRQHLDKLKNTQTELQGTQITTVSIPSGSTRTRDLAISRVANYQAHLEKVIDEALRQPPISDFLEIETTNRANRVMAQIKDKPEVKKILHSACSACKGGCCSAGKDSALISLETIKKAMDYLQTSDPNKVVRAYLDKLPDTVVEDSCIHHGTMGCTLPNEMRSAICNGYYCEDLKKVIEEDGLPLEKVVVVRFGYSQWEKYKERSDYSIKESMIL